MGIYELPYWAEIGLLSIFAALSNVQVFWNISIFCQFKQDHFLCLNAFNSHHPPKADVYLLFPCLLVQFHHLLEIPQGTTRSKCSPLAICSFHVMSYMCHLSTLFNFKFLAGTWSDAPYYFLAICLIVGAQRERVAEVLKMRKGTDTLHEFYICILRCLAKVGKQLLPVNSTLPTSICYVWRCQKSKPETHTGEGLSWKKANLVSICSQQPSST